MLASVLSLVIAPLHPLPVQEKGLVPDPVTAAQDDSAEDAESPGDRLVATIPTGYGFSHMAERVGRADELEYLDFAFAPGGTRVAFHAAKKDRVYGFLDGKDLGYGDKSQPPVFSRNGEHVVMAIGKTNKNRSEKWSVFVDGKRAAKEDWVGPLAISDDGNSIAYWTVPNFRLDPSGDPILTRACLVLGRRKSKSFRRKESDIYAWAHRNTAPMLSEDGMRALSVAHNDLDLGVVVGVGGSKDDVLHSGEGYIRQVAYSEDLSRVATVRRVLPEDIRGAERAESIVAPSYQLEIDGVPVEVDADATALPTFSRSGEHYGFVYLRDQSFGLGLDGELLPTSEHMILEVCPDSAGGRLVWIEHRGGELLESKWLQRNVKSDIYKGHSHMCSAYVGEVEGKLVLEDLEESEPFDKIYRFYLSPDEVRVAFLGHMQDQGYFVVCGDQKIGPFESVDRIEWMDDSTVGVGTREGNEFWWRQLSVQQ